MTAAQPSQETVRAVLAAVQVFSAQPDKASLDAANRWLQDFQHTPEAWGACNYILLASDTPPGAKTFAAQTFRAKVTFDLQQVDPSHRVGLRDSLISALRTFASGPRVIVIQISLALSGLALQMPEWKNVVPGLIESIGQDPSTVPALLQFLTVLPEEVNGNTRIPMSNEDYRARASELLTDHAPEVVKLLAMYMQASGVTQTIQGQIFRCLRSWISAGEIDLGSLTESSLFSWAFQALASDSLFDAAVDVICDIIHETQEVDDNMAMIELIVQQLLAIKPVITSAKEDPEKMRGYCRIFTEAGETYRQLVLAHPETLFPIVEAIAECSAYSDLDVVPITFNFWYRLAQIIAKRPSVPQQFFDVYQGLVSVMIKHLHFPLSPDAMSAQERDEFRAFRHVMGDTLKDCCFVLGSSVCLRTAYDMIVSSLSRPTTAWQEIEAPLFSMRSMGAEVDPNDEEVVPLIMDLIPKLPTHPRVRYAATLVISRYTEWVDRHPQYIQYQLSYISAGFEEPDAEVSAASGQAMKFLCKDCKRHLVPYLPQLHSFVQTVGQNLSPDDRLQVYEAIAHVISYMPMEEAALALRQFTVEILAKIEDVVVLPSPTKEEVQTVADHLEQVEAMLTVIQSFGEELPPACQNTCLELWPIIETVIQKFGGIAFISERSCGTLRLGLQFFGEAALPIIPSLLVRLSGAFESSGYPSYIWVSGKIVTRFGNEEAPIVHNSLRRSFEGINSHIFGMLKVQAANTIPDVIEDYVHYLARMLEFCPDLLFLSPSFPNTFRAVLSALTLYQHDIIYPSLEFVLNTLRHDCLTTLNLPSAPSPPPNFPLYAAVIRGVVDEQGFSLVGFLLAGMLSHFPEDSISSVVTIFKILAQLWSQQIVAWLPSASEHIPKESLPIVARNAFISEFTAAVTSREFDKVKPALLNLHRASRRTRDRTRLTALDT